MKPSAWEHDVQVMSLRESELADKREPFVRIFAVSGAGILIYIYTGWISALVWSVYFVIAFLMHLTYLRLHPSLSTRTEIAFAGLFFANLQLSFGWFPVVLFVNEARELMLVGGALLAAQMLFLVRRNDTLKIYQTVQILIVFIGSVIVYAFFLPVLETPLAIVGAALALVGLNYYFIQSVQVARRMRLSRSAAESQAHQATKMAAIGQLSGGVAHDFNNNLTAIIGSLELAKLTDQAEEREIILDNGLIAARQAAQTIRQLMIFARKEIPQMSVLDMSDVFAELVQLTDRLIPTSIRLEAIQDDQPLHFRANQNQLLSGLVNLVSNSIDAMPRGGVLKVQSKRTTLKAPMAMCDGVSLEPGDYVVISLQDTGHGIPEQHLSRVIEPFFTTKSVGKGTGLGLSMVSGMIKELQGGMLIESSSKGTTVSLFFPPASAPASQSADPPPTP